MFSKLNRLFKEESGITALETAIILIAFVVVASVFAFTILSAGTSSTEKSKAAIYTGLEQVEGSMEVVGSVIAKDTSPCNDVIDSIEFTLASVSGGEGMDMTDPTDGNNKLVIDYQDENQYITNLDWDTDWLVCSEGNAATDTNCDNLLEEDEQILITIQASELTTDLEPDTDFVFLVKPPQGGVIPVERRTPSDFTQVMNLD